MFVEVAQCLNSRNTFDNPGVVGYLNLRIKGACPVQAPFFMGKNRCVLSGHLKKPHASGLER